MQGIMMKMMFTELMRMVYIDYELKNGELYHVIDTPDQPMSGIEVLSNVNYYESIGMED